MKECIDFIRNLTESNMGISLIGIIFDKGPAIMSCPGALVGCRRPWWFALGRWTRCGMQVLPIPYCRCVDRLLIVDVACSCNILITDQMQSITRAFPRGCRCGQWGFIATIPSQTKRQAASLCWRRF